MWGNTESRDSMDNRVVFIMWCLSSRGIKLRSESQPEQAPQHVFKQKPIGRQAYRPQAAFSVPVSVM